MTLEPSRAKKWAFGIAAVLGLSTFRMGLFLDDHAFRAMVRGLRWVHDGPWDLYTFAPGDPERFRPFITNGPYPWWTPDALRIHFFRPLSSLAMWLDVQLFGDNYWPAHLHSLVWWFVTLAAVFAIFVRLFPAPVAALAMVLFALDDVHWIPVAWIANRHMLISGAFVFTGFWAWLKWRLDGTRWGFWVALLCFAASLAGGESALALLALVGAWELFARTAPLKDRVLGLVPLGLLGLAFVAVYRGLGYGTWGSGIYVDPGAQPGVFLSLAPGRFLALLAPMTLNIASDFFIVDDRLASAVVVAGALGLFIWAAAFRLLWPALSQEERTSLRWLIPAIVLSCIPSLATFPADRLLFAASFASTPLFAMLLHAGWNKSRRARIGVALLAAPHFLAPLGVWAVSPSASAYLDQIYQRAAVETQVSDEALRGRVIFLVAPDTFTAIYVPLLRYVQGKGEPRAWNVLSAAPRAHRLTRTAEKSFELAPVDGLFLSTTFERLFRNPSEQRFAVGDRVQLNGSQVTVVELNGELPARIRVDLDDDPSAYTFVNWTEQGIGPAALPPVGQTLELPRLDGPMQKAFGLGADN